jgi:cyclic beta-1,2-glucan synthetase
MENYITVDNDVQPADDSVSSATPIALIANSHLAKTENGKPIPLLQDFERFSAYLAEAHQHFDSTASDTLTISVAGEWLLDNFYIVQAALLQIQEDMPPAYYKNLPKLSQTELAGFARVYAIARDIVAGLEDTLSIEALQTYIKHYQATRPLTMGELWALPTMLRITNLENLVHVACRTTKIALEGLKILPPALPELITDEQAIANAISSLRILAATDWKDYFEVVSRTEAILREDPAAIYSRMDFETRNRYRTRIEYLAPDDGQQQEVIAQAAIDLARNAGEDKRTSHIGYYLIDDGLKMLEQAIQFQPSLYLRFTRWLQRHAARLYVTSILLLTFALLLLILPFVRSASPLQMVLLLFVAAWCVSSIPITVVNWLINILVPPQILPKMDYSDGIPASDKTIIVIPAILSSTGEIDSLIHQLEQHHLRNNDAHLLFALLLDYIDADQQSLPNDAELLTFGRESLQRLNDKYPDTEPFFLFVRERRWNESESTWMGWERKRGKLAEFNRWLLDPNAATTYTTQVGKLHALRGTKYVITLDADTILPKDNANRLIATMAHPLNRPVFNPRNQTVEAGYAILQPRVEILPNATNQTWFTRIFSPDTALDLYTRAVSNVYQDAFGEGIYIGKGIYDVAAFEHSLAGRIPENRLLSHDLFESLHARTALVTDIVLLEDYPPHYLVYTSRLQRWIRGDWQLLPWLTPSVPHATNKRTGNYLSLLDYWKIFDNLRRSLVAPALLGVLVASWLFVPASVGFWSIFALVITGMPFIITVLGEMLNIRDISNLSVIASKLSGALQRWLLSLIFLAHEALLSVKAMLVTVNRLLRKKHLLQWVTSAQTVRAFEHEVMGERVFRQMLGTLLAVVIITVLVVLFQPVSLGMAAPFLLAWALSLPVAYFLSRPVTTVEVPLSEQQRQQIRTVARRTWLFFEQYVSPEDHWLPPDHFQETPRAIVAHHTSPTNIGLLLLSTLAAYDFGYIGLPGLLTRLELSFESIGKLERYRGHLLNWYDSRKLQPLLPHYVSTVDSGNFIGCLIALNQGLEDVYQNALMQPQLWQGFVDTLDVTAEIIQDAAQQSPGLKVDAVLKRIQLLREQVLQASQASDFLRELDTIRDNTLTELRSAIAEFLQAEQNSISSKTIHDLQIYVDRLRHHVDNMRRNRQMLVGWQQHLMTPPLFFLQLTQESPLRTAWQQLTTTLATIPSFKQAPTVYQMALEQLDTVLLRLTEMDSEASVRLWCNQLGDLLAEAQTQTSDLSSKWMRLQTEINRYRQETDFAFLFSKTRKVFHIGYNINAEALDNSYYDLLASEARLASLLTIASNQIPQEHWLSLGRPLKRVNGSVALMSWTGTMFEYLMPRLLMREYPDTIITQSYHAAVAAQIAYSDKHNIPWGTSESGFYAFDGDLNYQYRAFGAPELAFKRGQETEQVIAPYASLIALPIKPQAVFSNMQRLNAASALGTYGYYEALDYTPLRVPLGQSVAVVREYMAHHQGMILLSLLNYLHDDIMVERFHADPYIESVELLLQEQMPGEIHQIPEASVPEASKSTSQVSAFDTSPWKPEIVAPVPRVHHLSNGDYGVHITSTGAGYSQWGNLALTRWRADTTLEDWGTWLYLRDEDNQQVWSLGYQPLPAGEYNALFYPHQAEFLCNAHDIAARMTVTVAPDDNVEIRQIRLSNRGDTVRHILYSSYGEVVLAPAMTDNRHPAFNKLFIETEFVAELNALLFTRRARSATETPPFMLHMLVAQDERQAVVQYETDRRQFLGRNRTTASPQALMEPDTVFTGVAATTLDPIMALASAVELKAHSGVEFAYITLVGASRDEVLTLAHKYRSWSVIERTLTQARYHSGQDLQQLGVGTADVERFQQLLSALLYPQPELRAEPELIARNAKPQSGLWAFGISGDYPILLVRISDESELPLVRDLIKAHTYWRQRKVPITLVILNQHDTSYTQELYNQVHRRIVRMHSETWINRHDGIFLLRADLLNESDHALLAASARVLLDGSKGTLAEQLDRLRSQPVYLPDFMPSLTHTEAQSATSALPALDKLEFDNGFGGFDPNSNEYVIYRPTPAPWLNVIANEKLGFTVSESGAGFSWSVNSSENRLSAWRNDPVTDMPSEIVYLRDEETGKVWTTTPLPVGHAETRVRHGFGYSTFEQNSHGLQQQLTLFTAVDEPVKIIRVELKNEWERVRRITVTYFAEWVLGTMRDITQQYIVPEFDAQTLLAHNPYSIDFSDSYMFVTASQDFHGLTADRREFLGRLGNYAAPAGLRRIGLSGTVHAGMDSCAAIQLHLNLAPNESQAVYFIVGGGVSRAEALTLAQQYRASAQLETAWQQTLENWQRILSSIEIETPEPSMNRIVPWLLYQALSCRIWGRSALYQSGGAYGFRDQLQDVMSIIHVQPQLARDHILRAARHQFENGDVLHWWHPPSGRGVRTRFSDDLIWLPFVTAYYVETTGDTSILEAQEPFRTGEPLREGEDERYNQYELTAQSYTLYEHCIRALNRGLTSGRHGLPLMGSGDWNDGMNRVGIDGAGESVWVGWFLCATLQAFIPLCEQMNEAKQATAYSAAITRLQTALETHAWDGAWYLRAFYDDGTPLGSAQNNECKIDSLVQSWGVISKAAQPQRAQQAMQSVLKHLYKPDEGLLLLFTPPFEATGKDPGYIKGYPPGVRENGGQYTHAALWTVWALAEMGDGDKAGEIFNLLNPINHSLTVEQAEKYRVEPYVVAADVYGAEPYIGMGGWTWYTGSSGWMYRLAIEAILGLRRRGDYLYIEPSIPKHWAHYQLTYRFGEAVYHIRVENPHGVMQGVSSVSIDGANQPNVRIPLSAESKHYEVVVQMGK